MILFAVSREAAVISEFPPVMPDTDPASRFLDSCLRRQARFRENDDNYAASGGN